ncbi:MAG: putative beta-lysine N-acetyltransferase [Desulfosarcinaceae bacterium]|nr:putative beta-lysine N-acetyltransferase [Desulfosarcinaceae bacterium]
MTDHIETIAGALIQHGRHNDRIYLMDLQGAKHKALIATLERMAVELGYGKIFAKIPATAWHAFQDAGYIREALVPGYFNGLTDGLFIAKFFSEARRKRTKPPNFDPLGSAGKKSVPTAIPSLTIQDCIPADSDAMAAVYRQLFESYAFPIDRPDYIRHMMRHNAVYQCAMIAGRIAAIAAAEINDGYQCCEMTDFATLPAYRRMGLATRLLDRLENEALKRGIVTAYTIARADSYGMNRAFQHMAYRYAGCLVKNTQIGGRIRSMNVWYKRLK